MGLVLRRKGLRPVGRRLGPLLSTPGRGAVAPGLPRLPSQAFPLLVPIRTHPALLDSLYAQWCCSSGFSAPLRSGSSKARVGGRGMETQAEAVSRLFPPALGAPGWAGEMMAGAPWESPGETVGTATAPGNQQVTMATEQSLCRPGCSWIWALPQGRCLRPLALEQSG